MQIDLTRYFYLCVPIFERMKRFLQRLCLALLLAASLFSCKTKEEKKESVHIGNAIYYWRTTFELDSTELGFLQRHNIERIYLRMFDVAEEFNPDENRFEAVPIATTRFVSDQLEEISKDIEIVPTVYITLNALRAMRNKEDEYAWLLVERLRAMASYNGCQTIREMQFDCDWTTQTRESYVALCRAARRLLQADKIELSITIRLHQLKEEAPPVDRGVLMIYNTGTLKHSKTRNSILDIADVHPYLSKRKCHIPLDYAYPAFGWGVKFWNGQFRGIVSHPENEELNEGETIRIERPTAREVKAIKSLIETALGAPSRYRILYHLDKEQLKYYRDYEISKIYANN